MAGKQNKKRILFFPVSSKSGMGEYVRSLCLAHALLRQTPEIEVAFGLNQNVGYAQDCPFPVFRLADTPTRCTQEVIAAINTFKPNVAVFDAAGRVRQLAYCKQNNVSTVFVAQHARKVDRALRLRRLRYTDVILVAQPREFQKKPGLIQGLWLTWMKKKDPLYVGPIFPHVTREAAFEYLKARGLAEKTYVLVNAGGGGNTLTTGSGKVNASELFLHLTKKLALESQLRFVVVMGRNYNGNALNGESAINNVMVIPWCAEEEFNALLSHASAGLLSGGSSLFQALASGLQNVLAVPVASDQQQRVLQCEKFYGIKSSKPIARNIESAFAELLNNVKETEHFSNQVRSMAGKKTITNGLDAATKTIQQLLDGSFNR